jgi:putative GTP pyrophosphokinase
MKNRSQEIFNSNEYAEKYKKCKAQYNKLGINLAQALELFLQENDIKILSINHRVKEDSSFLEKIERKHYENPFDEIEDICGIRIICYYQSDVEKISEILRNEFEVVENQDKEKLLKEDQFGYRSTHFIVKIKNDWLKAPNYRQLENLKAEIQIRTVLMHAWAEIEHKLVYKNEKQAPSQFRRKLSRISAKLEEADEQFEELRLAITDYKEEVTESFEKNEYEGVELNLDSLQAFLDKYFPERATFMSIGSRVVDEFLSNNITLKEIFDSHQKVKHYLPKIEEDFANHYGSYVNESGLIWNKFGVVRVILDLTNEMFFHNRKTTPKFRELIQKWREIIIQDEETKKNKKD